MENIKIILAKTFLTTNLLFAITVSLSFFVFGCDAMFMSSAPTGAFCKIDIPLISNVLIASQIVFALFILTCIVSFGLPVIVYGLLWWRSFVVAKENLILFVLVPVLIPLVFLSIYFVSSFNWDYAKYRLGIDNDSVAIQQVDNNIGVQNDVNDLAKTVTSNTACNESSLYGYSYYTVPNTTEVCYQNYQMKNADHLTLIPLEGVSRTIAQVLVPNIIVEEDFDFAFDKNNFYIDGDITYSVSKGTFELISMPKSGQGGAVVINGRSYTVTMTGLVGATLK